MPICAVVTSPAITKNKSPASWLEDFKVHYICSC